MYISLSFIFLKIYIYKSTPIYVFKLYENTGTVNPNGLKFVCSPSDKVKIPVAVRDVINIRMNEKLITIADLE